MTALLCCCFLLGVSWFLAWALWLPPLVRFFQQVWAWLDSVNAVAEERLEKSRSVAASRTRVSGKPPENANPSRAGYRRRS